MKLKTKDAVKVLTQALPIVRWSKNYNAETCAGDLIAGITVALTLVPQSIAYASLAGFEPQYGLYASFAGALVYATLGTVPQINIGPTALLSLLTFTYTNGTNTDFAVLLCLIGGIVQMIAGIAQLGFLVEFVSMPVVSGFTSAAAITIASSQIKGLLGLKFSSENFITTWENVFKHIGDTRLGDTLMSLACCVVLLAMKALKDVKLKTKEEHMSRMKIISRMLWFAGVGRNAAVVVLAALVGFLVHRQELDLFILTGNITPGLPIPQVPVFQTTVGNVTYSAKDMFSHLGAGLIVIPLVGIIANVAIAKAFSNGKPIEATQEIITLGLCNIVGSFFRSFPVNGSFTRSAVSDASGVRTPGSGFVTALIVILALVILTPYFFFIPRAALASVIICAVLQMVDVHIIKRLWLSSKFDLIPLMGTFILCLIFGMELGLLAGVAIDTLLILFYQSRPQIEVQYIENLELPPHYAIYLAGGLHFAAGSRIRTLNSIEKIKDIALNNRDSSCKEGLVFYCQNLGRVDYTALQSIKSLVKDHAKKGYKVIFCDASVQLQDQLNNTIDGVFCCGSSQLPALLHGMSNGVSLEVPHTHLEPGSTNINSTSL